MLSPIFIWAQLRIQISDIDGRPVPHAEVKYVQSSKAGVAFSNEHGSVKLDGVLAAISNPVFIEIFHLGYFSISDTLLSESFKTYRLTHRKVVLEEIVITGEQNPVNSSQSVRNVEVITSDQMEQLGAVSVGDALRQQLNLNLSTDNFLGNSVNINGFSGQNIKILLNGVPMVGRLNGNIDLSQIPVSGIEKIEIVKGPLSVQYGTDAMGGTINIITKSHKESSVETHGLYESSGHYNTQFNVTLKQKNDQFSLGGGRNYFDGWSLNDPLIEFPKSKLADSSRVQDFKPKMQYFLNGGYSHSFNRTSISPYISYFKEQLTNRGYPRQPYLETAFDDVFLTERLSSGINIDHSVSHSDKLKIQASYNWFERIKNTYIKDLTTLVSELANTSDVQDTTSMKLLNSRIIYNHHSSQVLKHEFGIDINHESVNGSRILDTKKQMLDMGVFATSDWQVFENWILKPGVRLVLNDQYGSQFVPSLSLKSQLNKLTLRGSAAKAFRAPSLKELYLDFVDINHDIKGNPQLEAEIGLHLSTGFTYSISRTKSVLQMGINTFYNEVENQIRLVSNGGPSSFTYQNIGHFQSTGFESDFRLITSRVRFEVGAGLASVQDDMRQGLGFDGYDHQFQANSSLALDIIEKTLSCSVFYKHIGPTDNLQILNDTEFGLFKANRLDLLDASLSYRNQGDNLSVTFGLKNILNESNTFANNTLSQVHSTNASTPVQPGVSLFASIKYGLEW